jgi:hypothetical protein
MLKEFYNKGLQDAFYVIKVWVKKSIDLYLNHVFFVVLITGEYGL